MQTDLCELRQSIRPLVEYKRTNVTILYCTSQPDIDNTRTAHKLKTSTPSDFSLLIFTDVAVRNDDGDNWAIFISALDLLRRYSSEVDLLLRYSSGVDFLLRARDMTTSIKIWPFISTRTLALVPRWRTEMFGVGADGMMGAKGWGGRGGGGGEGVVTGWGGGGARGREGGEGMTRTRLGLGREIAWDSNRLKLTMTRDCYVCE